MLFKEALVAEDYTPVTPAALRGLLAGYEARRDAAVVTLKAEYVEDRGTALMKRRWWGLLPPLMDHMPTYDEIMEHDQFSWVSSLERRTSEWIATIEHMIEIAPYDSVIYISTSTIQRLHSKSFGFFS
jgi:hypothetical protein